MQVAAPDGGWTTVDDGVSATPAVTVPGLRNGTAYRFRVAARNGAGDGAWSTEVTATPRTRPGPPRSLAAGAGVRLVRLSWRAPAVTGGAAVTDYVVQRARQRTGPWTTLRDGVSTRRSYTARNLRPGQVYWFRVAAVNAAGRGPWTAPVRGRPRG